MAEFLAKRRGWLALLGLILAVIVGWGGLSHAQEGHYRPTEPAARSEPAERGPEARGLPDEVEEAIVYDIVDGDTIEVQYPDDDAVYDVRLIGINAPESVRPNSPVECYGPESSERMAELLPLDSTVYLEGDASDTDDFGRLLRYVWVLPENGDDAEMINEVLAREGYVDVRRYRPDTKHHDRLQEAEDEAVAEAAGLWGMC